MNNKLTLTGCGDQNHRIALEEGLQFCALYKGSPIPWICWRNSGNQNVFIQGCFGIGLVKLIGAANFNLKKNSEHWKIILHWCMEACIFRPSAELFSSEKKSFQKNRERLLNWENTSRLRDDYLNVGLLRRRFIMFKCLNTIHELGN